MHPTAPTSSAPRREAAAPWSATRSGKPASPGGPRSTSRRSATAAGRAARRNTSSASRTSRSATTSASARSAPSRRRARRSGAAPPTTATSSGPSRPGRPPNGVFGAKLMWGYFGDFVSLAAQRPRLPRPARWPSCCPTVFPDLTFVRVVRANKVRQAVSLWKAVQTATWREDQASAKAASLEDDGSPPYRSFIEEHRPQLRFHYRAIDHLLEQILIEEASLGRLLRALRDQADPRPLRELRRRLRDHRPCTCSSASTSRRPTTSTSSRG